MSKKLDQRLRAAVALLAGFAAVSAAALDPQQFVTGWPLEVPADAEVFDVPLTVEMYAAASNVEQLAVLDANGLPLSFFKTTAPAPAATQQRVTIDASPLYADGRAAVATVGVTAGSAAVTITQPGTIAPDVTGFVLDARVRAVAPTALELDWRALPQPFLLDVRVEQSTDLTDWRLVGAASVAALTVGAAEVRHTRVPVTATAGGYLRVTAGSAVADWYLLRATLVSAASDPTPLVVARVPPLVAAPEGAPDGAVFFDAGAVLPVATLALDFGAAGGWAQADVATSDSLEGPWTTVVYNELFYALDFGGQRFASPAHEQQRAARYWRVQPAVPVRNPGFALVLEYRQEYLRVAGRSSGPYLLVAGTLAAEAGPDAAFASVWRQMPAAAPVPEARVGPRRELGGPAVLLVPRQFPWRLAALWAALAGGVLVVAWMAVRLAREMHTETK
jgi:hypothetical protein